MQNELADSGSFEDDDDQFEVESDASEVRPAHQTLRDILNRTESRRLPHGISPVSVVGRAVRDTVGKMNDSMSVESKASEQAQNKGKIIEKSLFMEKKTVGNLDKMTGKEGILQRSHTIKGRNQYQSANRKNLRAKVYQQVMVLDAAKDQAGLERMQRIMGSTRSHKSGLFFRLFVMMGILLSVQALIALENLYFSNDYSLQIKQLSTLLEISTVSHKLGAVTLYMLATGRNAPSVNSAGINPVEATCLRLRAMNSMLDELAKPNYLNVFKGFYDDLERVRESDMCSSQGQLVLPEDLQSGTLR